MNRIILLVIPVLLSACSSPHVLPDRGDDIKTIYDRHVTGKSPETTTQPATAGNDTKLSKVTVNYQPIRPASDNTQDLAPFTRNQYNETRPLFPVLPNPQLVMYVRPHLSLKGHPIPGYSVPFRMYEKDEYAMPGEVKE